MVRGVVLASRRTKVSPGVTSIQGKGHTLHPQEKLQTSPQSCLFRWRGLKGHEKQLQLWTLPHPAFAEPVMWTGFELRAGDSGKQPQGAHVWSPEKEPKAMLTMCWDEVCGLWVRVGQGFRNEPGKVGDLSWASGGQGHFLSSEKCPWELWREAVPAETSRQAPDRVDSRHGDFETPASGRFLAFFCSLQPPPVWLTVSNGFRVS